MTTKFMVDALMGNVNLQVALPEDLTCSQCILQVEIQGRSVSNLAQVKLSVNQCQIFGLLGYYITVKSNFLNFPSCKDGLLRTV